MAESASIVPGTATTAMAINDSTPLICPSASPYKLRCAVRPVEAPIDDLLIWGENRGGQVSPAVRGTPAPLTARRRGENDLCTEPTTFVCGNMRHLVYDPNGYVWKAQVDDNGRDFAEDVQLGNENMSRRARRYSSQGMPCFEAKESKQLADNYSLVLFPPGNPSG